MEGAGHRLPVRRAVRAFFAATVAAEVEAGGERRPARRAEQRVEVFRGHGAAAGGVRQRVRLQQVAAGLELPQEAFFGGGVVVPVFQVDEVEAPRLAVEGLDARHHAAPVAHGGEHPGAGNGGLRRDSHELPSPVLPVVFSNTKMSLKGEREKEP